MSALFLSLLLTAQDTWVSPSGQDTNVGTKDAPFATPARALREKRGGRVLLRGGTYFLPEPLVFKAEDSGATWEAAPGEKPVLSAGRPITGWKRGENGVWTAPATGLFRQLFVDGKRAIRARSPNADFFRVQGEVSLEKQATFQARAGDLRPGWVGAEVIVLQSWAEMRSPIVSLEGHTATLAGQCAKYNREANARYWVENAPDLLDAPGEWFLDPKAGVVSYKPLEGQDPSKVEVIAASLPQVVRFEGAKSVRLKGLTFSHSDWSMGPKGYTDVQAAFDIPGAVWGERTESVTLEDCTVAHVGGYGIEFAKGCKGVRIVGCEIVDAGAGGIKIGETSLRKEEADKTAGNVVTDNHVHDLGHVYPAGVGIWVGHSSRNTLAHNHVHDAYYSGFSIGWSWGYGPSGAQENLIEQNHVHHIGRGMLADMGGIYTLGTCTGTVIRNNVFHDVWSSTYGGWGIYFDEGSTGVLAENNIAYRCKSNGFHQHYGKENVLRNNIFALNAEAQIARTRKEPHLTLTFERNIVYWKEGKLVSGNWEGDQFRWEKNLFWNPAGTKGLPEAWREKGLDRESVIADPLFVDPEKGDFTLKPESPALKMGFRPIDVSKVGPRGRR
ncbi:MAG TPA: right-handed parallel beta-helix repeat-containing protein [Planctomycetota bacterium]|nr:right-handed parallel beta-helix repeat-containing protein [Planctomycetota bacterium]